MPSLVPHNANILQEMTRIVAMKLNVGQKYVVDLYLRKGQDRANANMYMQDFKTNVLSILLPE